MQPARTRAITQTAHRDCGARACVTPAGDTTLYDARLQDGECDYAPHGAPADGRPVRRLPPSRARGQVCRDASGSCHRRAGCIDPLDAVDPVLEERVGPVETPTGSRPRRCSDVRNPFRVPDVFPDVGVIQDRLTLRALPRPALAHDAEVFARGWIAAGTAGSAPESARYWRSPRARLPRRDWKTRPPATTRAGQRLRSSTRQVWSMNSQTACS